jgi:hypothetical protein
MSNETTWVDQTGYLGQLRLDTLYLGAYLSSRTTLIDDLYATRDECRLRAQAGFRGEQLVTLGGVEFILYAHGAGRYGLLLRTRCNSIELKADHASSFNPDLKIRFGSSWCTFNSYAETCTQAYRILREFGELGRVIPCELHVCMDCPFLVTWQHFMCLRGRGRRAFINRTDPTTGYFSGFDNGHSSNADLGLTLYNKVLEGREDYQALWARIGKPADMPITRVEIKMRRGYLKAMRVDTWDDLTMDKVIQAWEHATSSFAWLVHPDDVGEKNKDRARLHPDWEYVTRGFQPRTRPLPVPAQHSASSHALASGLGGVASALRKAGLEATSSRFSETFRRVYKSARTATRNHLIQHLRQAVQQVYDDLPHIVDSSAHDMEGAILHARAALSTATSQATPRTLRVIDTSRFPLPPLPDDPSGLAYSDTDTTQRLGVIDQRTGELLVKRPRLPRGGGDGASLDLCDAPLPARYAPSTPRLQWRKE